ncbi:multicopper oxidase domain-containing protein [Deinococcus hopiensis]|uniref:Multicopper oxidase with three cupredoxin domains (Includes cell division protein FtsP and spore coat protein CotA) n=1 Tax=Deinococcus hopiensis KR-140 TaxID=695939 RepID=A0A1W1UD72_9DEIO|nr:multicopper oxidase domain-containing protein [Deinococcus hopiensis]SMB79000.1 Multicopper oxidase with three cupredoxin domains (includes cell division protein FtsP and spore coat protein CotA) [Deinococcus hopiensis KR-140]
MSPLPPRFRFRPAPRLTSWVLGVLLLLGGPTRALDVPHEHPAPSSGSFAAHDSLIRDFVAAPNGTVPLKNFTGQVREFTLEVHETMSEITPGVRVKQWAFGFPGQPPSVPGPELRVKVGDLVRITLRNTTDRAHSIHLHGITSLAQGMDGVPHTSQAVLPGQSFSYAFVATDAGTHMYHCHVETNLHLDMGMYGALIVEPRDKPIWAKDHVLMLDEWDSHQDPDVIPHRTNPNYFLVNGRSYPLIPDLQIPQGEVHLIRLLNIGQEVHSMHLHGMTFLVVAKDGQDLPLPYRADTVLIAPGERYDLLVKGRDGTFPFHDHIPPHSTNDGVDPGGIHLMVVGGPELTADSTPVAAAPAHPHDHGAPSPPAQNFPVQGGTVEVHISGFKYAPGPLHVERGTKVVWINDDMAAHTIEVKGVKVSPPLRKGGRFAVTFDQAGTYTVVCAQHSFMTATVTVEP